MASQSYCRFQDIKDTICELGDTNNKKIQIYCEFADSYINAKLKNVNGVTLPIADPDETLRDLATQLAVAFFFSMESGDENLKKEAKEQVDMYFQSCYQRPRFKARSGC